jgi:protein-L-isoaspartate O-methyltransferase
MLATRSGLARLTDLQAIVETMVLHQYGAFAIQPGWAILDIGAGIGDFAAYARRRGAGKVIAYECDLFCAPALRANGERYGFEVVLERVTSLERLPEADLVKIDIEGGEFGLFPSGRYPRLIMEYHVPYGDPETLAASLRTTGYHVSVKPNRWRTDIGMLAAWRA